MKVLSIIVSIIFAIESVYGQTTVMMPMRDSVHLATNIYLPPDTAIVPVPVVINRTPYGRGPAGEFQESLFAHGIGFISQDTRGRGGSEGEDSIFWDIMVGLKNRMAMMRLSGLLINPGVMGK